MAASLKSLSNELIMQVFDCLIPYDTERTRTIDLDVHDLWRDFYETLTSACLVSKHIALFATPILYSGIFFCGSEICNVRCLRLACTLMKKPLLSRYVACIHDETTPLEKQKDVEDAELLRNARTAAKALWGRASYKGWSRLLYVTPGKAVLLLLLKLAINVRQLRINTEPRLLLEFCRLLGMDWFKDTASKQFHDGGRKLQILEIITEYIRGPRKMTLLEYHWVLECLQHFQKFQRFKHFGLHLKGIINPLQAPLTANFATLRVLHLQEMNIPLGTAASIMESCKQLQSFCYCSDDCAVEDFSISPLYPALYRNRATLEQIEISGGHNFKGSFGDDPICSFKAFEQLRILRLPNNALTGLPPYPIGIKNRKWPKQYRPPMRIVELLPNVRWLHLSASTSIQ